MQKEKSQLKRLLDGFITAVIVITAVTLVASGISISKINTEYLETGVRASKIVAEHKSKQIIVTHNKSVLLSSDRDYSVVADKILTFLPPPVNTVYLTAKEFLSATDEKNTIQP